MFSKSRLELGKTTLIGGILFLVPVVILIAILGKAVSIMMLVASPMADLLPVDTVGGVALANLLALIGLLLICYIAGICARVATASNAVKTLESRVLMNIPGYAVIKAMTSGIDPDNAEHMRPVLVTMGSVQRIGYETQKLRDDRSLVFLPGTPNAWSGISQIMQAEDVQYLDSSVIEVMDFTERYGQGVQGIVDRCEMSAISGE